MRHDEQVDDLFKNGFQPDFTEEIPREFLTDVNARLDQLEKTKKRPLAIWWVSGILSVFGILIFVYTINSKENSVNLSVKSKVSKASLEKNAHVKIATTVSSNFIAKNANGQLNNSKSNNIIDQKNTNSTKESLNHPEFLLNQKTGLEKTSSSEKRLNRITKTTTASREPITLNEEEVLLGKSSSLAYEGLTKEVAIQQEIINDSTQVKSVFSEEKIESNAVKNDSTILNAVNENPISVNATDKGKKQKLNYCFGFYSGVSEIFHQVLAPNNISVAWTNSISPEEYRNKRKMEEKSLTSWDMAIRFGIQYRKFTFSTGVDYFVLGERTDYSNVTYNAQYQNKYQFVNVPLVIGFQIQKGSFGVQPSIGLSLGFLAKDVTGFYLNLDNTSSSYQANISKVISTLHTGVEISYFSQSGIKVSVSPVYRKSLTPVVQSELVRNSYSTLGLQLGIGYRW
jgi:hypothetical protein